MYDAHCRRAGLGVVYDQSVEEGGVAAVADAVDVAAGIGSVEGVEGWEFWRVCFLGGDQGSDFSGFACCGYIGAADAGELEAC